MTEQEREAFEEKCARNARVQSRYDELMREGKHGHYETMFRVVREEVERARAALAEVDEENAQLREQNTAVDKACASYEAENKRLTACLKKANEQAEHFEREWYFRGDVMERQEARIDALQEDLSALAAKAVPAGWKLVPVEPTEDMLFAAEISKPRGYRDLWDAMLAATPPAPAPEATPAQAQQAVAWQSRSSANDQWEPCTRTYYEQQKALGGDDADDVRALAVISQ